MSFQMAVKESTEIPNSKIYHDVLTPEQAKACLNVHQESLTVHTQIQSGMMLMGADWDLQEIHDLLDNPNVILQIGGSHCIAIGHGLVAIRPNDKPLFISHNDKLFELKNANQLSVVKVPFDGPEPVAGGQ